MNPCQTPKEIWETYGNKEKLFIEHIFPVTPWLTGIVYPGVKCVVFAYCDRGISCWKEFADFLRRSFPDLESLFLQQTYTGRKCKEAEEKHFLDFFYDPWLLHIWIYDHRSGFIDDARIVPDGKVRVLLWENNCGCGYDPVRNERCPHELLKEEMERLVFFCQRKPSAKGQFRTLTSKDLLQQ